MVLSVIDAHWPEEDYLRELIAKSSCSVPAKHVHIRLAVIQLGTYDGYHL